MECIQPANFLVRMHLLLIVRNVLAESSMGDQGQGEDDDSYGHEMRMFLNYDDVLKPGQVGGGSRGGIARYCQRITDIGKTGATDNVGFVNELQHPQVADGAATVARRRQSRILRFVDSSDDDADFVTNSDHEHAFVDDQPADKSKKAADVGRSVFDDDDFQVTHRKSVFKVAADAPHTGENASATKSPNLTSNVVTVADSLPSFPIKCPSVLLLDDSASSSPPFIMPNPPSHSKDELRRIVDTVGRQLRAIRINNSTVSNKSVNVTALQVASLGTAESSPELPRANSHFATKHQFSAALEDCSPRVTFTQAFSLMDETQHEEPTSPVLCNSRFKYSTSSSAAVRTKANTSKSMLPTLTSANNSTVSVSTSAIAASSANTNLLNDNAANFDLGFDLDFDSLEDVIVPPSPSHNGRPTTLSIVSRRPKSLTQDSVAASESRKQDSLVAMETLKSPSLIGSAVLSIANIEKAPPVQASAIPKNIVGQFNMFADDDLFDDEFSSVFNDATLVANSGSTPVTNSHYTTVETSKADGAAQFSSPVFSSKRNLKLSSSAARYKSSAGSVTSPSVSSSASGSNYSSNTTSTSSPLTKLTAVSVPNVDSIATGNADINKNVATMSHVKSSSRNDSLVVSPIVSLLDGSPSILKRPTNRLHQGNVPRASDMMPFSSPQRNVALAATVYNPASTALVSPPVMHTRV
jgi:hypothetical protein